MQIHQHIDTADVVKSIGGSSIALASAFGSIITEFDPYFRLVIYTLGAISAYYTIKLTRKKIRQVEEGEIKP